MTHEERLREAAADGMDRYAPPPVVTESLAAACLAGAEALRLLRKAIKGDCPWCRTIWTSQEFCCKPMQQARALLATEVTR